MGQNPNVARLREGYEAFDKADFDTVRGFIAEDAVWHVGGNNPLSGDYKGQDEIFGMFAQFVQLTNGTAKNEIHDVLANDEHGTVLVHFTAQREDGRSLDINEVHIVHLRDSQITEWWSYSEDLARSDAFFS